MKSLFTLAGTVLLMASSVAFASGQPPAPASTPDAAMQAQKKQLRTEKKAALKACKTLKGAEKSTCQKDANTREMAAMAELKAKK